MVTVWYTLIKKMQASIKRLLDILSASVLFVLTSPLFVLTALLIKLDSPGPVFFCQKRLGKDGKYFNFYKFRSMYAGCSEEEHKEYIRRLMTEELAQEDKGKRVYKLTSDSRVTPVGRFIRRLSIDELAQLFNVIKGDMSMVGPRPAIPYELQYHDEAMRKRFSVKPGITGLWQVSGRSGTTYRQMVGLDLFYIEHWSIWLDLKIMLKTVPYILKAAQAY